MIVIMLMALSIFSFGGEDLKVFTCIDNICEYTYQHANVKIRNDSIVTSFKMDGTRFGMPMFGFYGNIVGKTSDYECMQYVTYDMDHDYALYHICDDYIILQYNYKVRSKSDLNRSYLKLMKH